MTGDYSRTIVSILSVALTLGSLYFLFRAEPPKDDKRVIPTEGGLGLSDEEREIFIPSNVWKPVKDHHVCPPGLEYRMNLSDGTKFARLSQ